MQIFHTESSFLAEEQVGPTRNDALARQFECIQPAYYPAHLPTYQPNMSYLHAIQVAFRAQH